jgi:hypothetical protein
MEFALSSASLSTGLTRAPPHNGPSQDDVEAFEEAFVRGRVVTKGVDVGEGGGVAEHAGGFPPQTSVQLQVQLLNGK